MSAEYDDYLAEHCHNVGEAFKWLESNVPEVLEGLDSSPYYWNDIEVFHDSSKWSDEEYQSYDNYFYGNKSYAVVNEFDYAWLHHIHNNPHHWQYWILLEDEGKQKALEIPERYVIEMVSDWMSFSIKKNDIRELFKWYDSHKDKMILHPNTRKLVEKILDAIDKKLKENEEFQNESEETTDEQKD